MFGLTAHSFMDYIKMQSYPVTSGSAKANQPTPTYTERYLSESKGNMCSMNNSSDPSFLFTAIYLFPLQISVLCPLLKTLPSWLQFLFFIPFQSMIRSWIFFIIFHFLRLSSRYTHKNPHKFGIWHDFTHMHHMHHCDPTLWLMWYNSISTFS